MIADNDSHHGTLRGPTTAFLDSDDRNRADSANLNTPAVLHSPRPLLEERRPTATSSRSRRTTRSSSQRRRTHSSPPRSNEPPLRIADSDLVALARQAAGTIDWDALCARSSVWDKHNSVGDFGLYSRRSGRVYHVMASGSVACSVTEMYHVLCTTSSTRYTAAMKELHGASFASGEVVHRVNTRHAVANSTSDARDKRTRMFDLTVKTATFAKAHVLARDEHWCFLELFQPQPDQTKFVLTMHSLCPSDVFADTHAPTSNQLEELAAGYSVVADPRRKLVWVVFYAQFTALSTSSSSSLCTKVGRLFDHTYARKRTVKARLLKLAKATCSLPVIVQRRRLGAQVFVDSKAFAPPNAHCICCTTALPLFARTRTKTQQQRCHLCGYYVCTKCSHTQAIERAHTHLAPPPRRRPVVRVCVTCIRRVNNAHYDNLPGGLLSPSAITRDAPDTTPPTTTLAGLVRDSFIAAKDASRKRALVRVAELLLEQPSGCPRTASNDDDDTVIQALETDLCVREFALDECVLGNADSRTYPIAYTSEADDTVPGYPVPANDAQRMSAARQQRLVAALKNAPELEVICAIACKELECAMGLVTLVGVNEVHVLAASTDAFRDVVVPREESICAHAIMTDKPLLLPFVDADVRFHRFQAVQQGALNFYCGFPLIVEDKSVVGTVCCIDNEAHTVTQAQYAVMIKLASTAARVMDRHAKAEAEAAGW